MSEVIALRNCKDCIHVDVCRYRTDPGSKDCLCKHSAADVRPVVRGRWIKQDDDPLDGNFYCSACNSRIDIATGLETPIDRGLFFCPNCGADMRGGDEQ